MASIAADMVTRAWGIRHTVYSIPVIPHATVLTLGLTVLAGIVFGVAGMLFADATHGLSALIKRHIAYPPMRPF
ncbi:Chloride/fluoride channel protein (plasmid) [Caballeronia sp. SBC2]|nr:Chloride/fluoride channel protein [Caballeronia sp. SBC2]